ncbi:hypothetical protein ABZT47_31760 [Sphaerisporangium sp. NPDC005289]|uniref:hypothetical protein n=1 Tax=Sphaerisporangium sp. NPDC005289 TaxID=3155247 RepID=UPI0033A9EABF
MAGEAATFEWNELGELARATVNGQGTSMVYGADGECRLRRDPGGMVTLLGTYDDEGKTWVHW